MAVTLVPTRADVVLTLMLGSGVTVNVNGADTAPPGAGVATVTSAVPSAARSFAEIVAFNCVLLTNVVVRLDRSQRTTDVVTKPLPLSVSVNDDVPVGMLGGDSEVSTGTGLDGATTVTGGLVAARV